MEKEATIRDLQEQISSLQSEISSLLKQNTTLMEQNMVLREDYQACLASNARLQGQMNVPDSTFRRRFSAPLLAEVLKPTITKPLILLSHTLLESQSHCPQKEYIYSEQGLKASPLETDLSYLSLFLNPQTCCKNSMTWELAEHLLLLRKPFLHLRL